MKASKLILTATCLLTCFFAFPQQRDGYRIIQEIMDELILELDDESLAEDLNEALFTLYENPIEVNKATEGQLKELVFLTDSQIHNLLTYIKEKGALLTIFELQLIEDFDERAIERISPFIAVAPVQGQYKRKSRNELLVRVDRTFEHKKGFINRTNANSEFYEGPSIKQLVKFKSFKTNRHSMGFVMENDAGENYRWKPRDFQYGPDFLSGHLAIEKRGIVDRVVLGDYQMNIGQGLTLSHAFSIGKSAETVKIRKSNRGLKTYMGSQEYNFFRGVAASVSLKNIMVTPFFSRKYLDARINLDNETGNVYASSIINSGMHRTIKELTVRQKLSETVYGADISYNSQNRRLETGLTLVNTQFGMPLQPNKTIYNQFAFSGSQLFNAGARFAYTFRNMSLFGEFSSADLKSFGGLTGIQSVLTPHATIAVLYRNYGKAYKNFYGQAFNESSTSNEEGVYWGMNLNLNQQWKVNLYYDLFRFHWMKYQVYSPSTWGTEFLSRITYFPNRMSVIYLQYKTESKDKNTETFAAIQQTTQMRKNQYLLNVDANPANMINMRFRVQGSVYDHHQGIALSQDLNFIFSKIRWYNRYAIFDTETYDNRQYMYEKDVLYAFTFPALYGNGVRYYSMMEYKASRNISFWVRIARTRYNDRESIGTGLEEIQGPKKTDLKLQARYVF
jgi:hypothetical protein